MKIISIVVKEKEVCFINPRERSDGGEYDTVTVYFDDETNIKLGIYSGSQDCCEVVGTEVSDSFSEVISSDPKGSRYKSSHFKTSIEIDSYEIKMQSMDPVNPSSFGHEYSAGVVFYGKSKNDDNENKMSKFVIGSVLCYNSHNGYYPHGFFIKDVNEKIEYESM